MTDLTEGSILGKIVPFALPIIAGNILQQLYNVTDTLIVGKTLGVLRLAALGASSSINFLMFGFVMGLTSGCAVIISQTYGAKDMDGVRRAVAAHIVIAATFALTMTTLFLLGARPVLKLMRTPADVIDFSTAYITIIYQGITVTMLYNLLSASLRAVGDSRTPLMFLLFSSALNIALDLLFIVVFRWDVQGAAIATVLAQFTSAFLCCVYLRCRVPDLIPDRSSWRGVGPVVLKELRVGVPMGLQYTVLSAGMMILQSVVNGFGASAVAAMAIATKMHELMSNPLTAMSIAVATYVAQNLGAGRYDRIITGVHRSLLFTLCMAWVIGGTVFLFRDAIVGLFITGHQPEVMSYACRYLNWECPGITAIAFLFTYRGAIQGFGMGSTVIIAGFIELGMRLLSSVVGSRIVGFTGICMAATLAWTFGSLFLIPVFYHHALRGSPGGRKAQA